MMRGFHKALMTNPKRVLAGVRSETAKIAPVVGGQAIAEKMKLYRKPMEATTKTLMRKGK